MKTFQYSAYTLQPVVHGGFELCPHGCDFETKVYFWLNTPSRKANPHLQTSFDDYQGQRYGLTLPLVTIGSQDVGLNISL